MLLTGFVLRHACCPAACTVTGPGIAGRVEAADVVRFAIQPCDNAGRELRDPGGHVSFSVEVHDVASGAVEEAQVEPNTFIRRVGISDTVLMY